MVGGRVKSNGVGGVRHVRSTVNWVCFFTQTLWWQHPSSRVGFKRNGTRWSPSEWTRWGSWYGKEFPSLAEEATSAAAFLATEPPSMPGPAAPIPDDASLSRHAAASSSDSIPLSANMLPVPPPDPGSLPPVPGAKRAKTTLFFEGTNLPMPPPHPGYLPPVQGAAPHQELPPPPPAPPAEEPEPDPLQGPEEVSAHQDASAEAVAEAAAEEPPSGAQLESQL